jgi:hypothetical protein
MKTGLPDFGFVAALFVNFMGTATLNKLQVLFQCGLAARGQEQVQMVWHQDKFMEPVRSDVVVVKHLADNNFRNLLNVEKRDVLGRLCGAIICASWGGAVAESSHGSETSGAEAQFVAAVDGGAEAPTPTILLDKQY